MKITMIYLNLYDHFIDIKHSYKFPTSKNDSKNNG